LPEDRDKKLRGLVYQMLNAVALGNRDKFIEMLIRIYSGANKPVPDIFLTCFAGDDEFKEIAFAYLLGLKSETIKKEEV
ncbi:MAG: type I-B CRISPR-associated protein Cas8b1/Cst1, partial [Oscillospiraceae bacterium]